MRRAQLIKDSVERAVLISGDLCQFVAGEPNEYECGRGAHTIEIGPTKWTLDFFFDLDTQHYSLFLRVKNNSQTEGLAKITVKYRGIDYCSLTNGYLPHRDEIRRLARESTEDIVYDVHERMTTGRDFLVQVELLQDSPVLQLSPYHEWPTSHSDVVLQFGDGEIYSTIEYIRAKIPFLAEGWNPDKTWAEMAVMSGFNRGEFIALLDVLDGKDITDEISAMRLGELANLLKLEDVLGKAKEYLKTHGPRVLLDKPSRRQTIYPFGVRGFIKY